MTQTVQKWSGRDEQHLFFPWPNKGQTDLFWGSYKHVSSIYRSAYMSYKVSPLELPTSRAQIFPQARSVSGRFFMFSAAKASERAGAFCPWAEWSTSGYSLKSIQLFLKSLPLSVPNIVNTQVVTFTILWLTNGFSDWKALKVVWVSCVRNPVMVGIFVQRTFRWNYINDT